MLRVMKIWQEIIIDIKNCTLSFNGGKVQSSNHPYLMNFDKTALMRPLLHFIWHLTLHMNDIYELDAVI